MGSWCLQPAKQATQRIGLLEAEAREKDAQLTAARADLARQQDEAQHTASLGASPGCAREGCTLPHVALEMF